MFHDIIDRYEVLERLAPFVDRSLLERLKPYDVVRMLTRPFGAMTRIFVSKEFSNAPDLQLPTKLWNEWQ